MPLQCNGVHLDGATVLIGNEALLAYRTDAPSYATDCLRLRGGGLMASVWLPRPWPPVGNPVITSIRALRIMRMLYYYYYYSILSLLR